MTSVLLGLWNGGGGVLLLSCPVQWVWLVPHSSHCSAGEYRRHVGTVPLPGVWCGCVCLWCSCGGVSSVHYPPRRGGGWGRRGWWGAVVVVGGMVSEGW